MNLKVKIRQVLRENYGSFDTYLEHQYEDRLLENLLHGDTKKKKAWVTYNQVVLELKHTLKDSLKVKELQYKLTENADPNVMCIEVMEDIKFQSPELERLYYKITNLI